MKSSGNTPHGGDTHYFGFHFGLQQFSISRYVLFLESDLQLGSQGRVEALPLSRVETLQLSNAAAQLRSCMATWPQGGKARAPWNA
jgi:hypothetical protein